MEKGISVIIPVHNRESLVVRTLDSVYGQTIRPRELIVVDNNSTDGTRAAIERWKEEHEMPGFRIVTASESTPGAAAARQTGFRLATSETVLFFDSDDVMSPQLVERVSEAFRRNHDCDLVCWKVAYGTLTADGKRAYKRFSTRSILRRHLLNGMLSTQAYAVKADFFRRAGGWNPSLPCWNDLELGLRLLLLNPRVEAIGEPLVTVYPQTVSITGTDFKSKKGQWEMAIEAMERVAERQPEPLRSKVRSLLLYRRVNLAALYRSEGDLKAAEELLESSLERYSPPAWRKALLKLIYQYTSRGGRCAYLLWL